MFFLFRILQPAGELRDTEGTRRLLTGLKAEEENTNQKPTGVPHTVLCCLQKNSTRSDLMP